MTELARPDDVRAAAAARAELGPEREEEIVAALVERMERRLEQRIDERLAQHPRRRGSDGEFALLAISIVVGIPLSLGAFAAGGLVPMLIVLGALALANVGFSRLR